MGYYILFAEWGTTHQFCRMGYFSLFAKWGTLLFCKMGYHARNYRDDSRVIVRIRLSDINYKRVIILESQIVQKRL